MDHTNRLTKAALGHILEGEAIREPIIQMLAYKFITQPDGSIRCRLNLNDGIYLYQCCLIVNNDLISKIDRNEIDRFCLLKIKQYHVNQLELKKIIVLTDLEIVIKGEEIKEKLADPIAYGSPNAPPIQNFTPNYHLDSEMFDDFNDDDELFCRSLDQLHNEYCNGQKISSPTKRFKNSNNSDTLDTLHPYSNTNSNCSLDLQQTSINSSKKLNPTSAIPIAALNLYSRNWLIKGRVKTKTDPKKWSNSRAQGSFFSFFLQDSSGEIKLTAFNTECAEFSQQIQFDRCYLVSRGVIKQADRQYHRSGYEIICTKETIIEPILDANVQSQCPPIVYRFVDFSSIQTMPVNSLIDVLGIVVEVNEAKSIIPRTSSSEKLMRNIQLLDQTKNQIMFTLWGEIANPEVGDVILAKDILLSGYSERSLTTVTRSMILRNPELEQAYNLKAWYAEQKNTCSNITKLTTRSMVPTMRWSILSQIDLYTVKNLNQRMHLVKAIITRIIRSNMYKACKKCGKKLNEIGELLRCDRCSIETSDCFDWGIMLVFEITDHSSSTSVRAFSDVNKRLFDDPNLNLNQLASVYQEQPRSFDDQLSTVQFKSKLFKLRSRIEIYNDREIVSSYAEDVYELHTNNNDYCKRLLNGIRSA